MKTIKLRFSENLIRKITFAFWWRVIGWRFMIASIIVLLTFIYLLSTGNRSWEVGLIGAVLCLALIMPIAVYFSQYRASLSRLRRMRSPEAIFEPSDLNFRLASDLGSSETTWSTIIKVWRFPDFWLLFISHAQFITFPLADLDKEERDYVLQCLRAHGIPVS